MCNKVKPEQCFVIRSAIRVAVFQASSKLVREMAEAISLTRILIILQPMNQNIYVKGDATNTNASVIQR